MNKKHRILTVDDEDQIRMLVCTILSTQGHEVFEASDGEEGVQIAQRELPDLILLDVNMPGVDGLEAARRLKADEHTRSIPIIMLTGLGTSESKIAGLNSGADEYVTKPISGAELLARANALLRMKDLQEELVRLEKERHQAQMLLAREVQEDLLPAEVPQLAGLDLAVQYQPCDTIGGDFYDFFKLGPDRLFIICGDAEGHGISASLIMARASAYVRASLQSGDISPAAVMNAVNRLICSDHSPSILLPMVSIYLNLGENLLRYCNAGHQFPFLAKIGTGENIQMESTGPMLGLDEDHYFEERRLNLDSGDVLACFTDGLPDVVDENDAMFGHETLERVILTSPEAAAKDLVRQAFNHWFTYCRGKPHDDCTLLIAKFQRQG